MTNGLINSTLEKIASNEKKSIISGPFGSSISKKYFKEEGIPVIRGNNLSLNGEKFIDDGFVFVTDEKARELNCYAKCDDLVFTAVGTIGQVGIITSDLDYNEYVISNKQLRVRLDANKILPLYAFYWFSSKWIQKLIKQRNVGSTVPLINLTVLRQLTIWYPESLNKQYSAVNILENLNKKIELNNKINAELEATAKLIYDYWFVQFDFPDENGKPYKSSGGKMVYNEELKREIPEGWEMNFLTDEMDLQYGFPFSTKLFNSEKKGVPVVRIRDIQNCTISNYSTEEVDNKYKINSGDVLVGMDGNFHINYWNKENCYLNQRCLRIRSNDDSISEIQARYSIEPYLKAREKNVSRTTVAHLSARDVNDLKVIKANRIVQNKANSFFKSNLEKIVTNRKENEKLAELRDWLLPMLMNGQVTVN